jgi:hypothetical protein
MSAGFDVMINEGRIYKGRWQACTDALGDFSNHTSAGFAGNLLPNLANAEAHRSGEGLNFTDDASGDGRSGRSWQRAPAKH